MVQGKAGIKMFGGIRMFSVQSGNYINMQLSCFMVNISAEARWAPPNNTGMGLFYSNVSPNHIKKDLCFYWKPNQIIESSVLVQNTL